MSVDLRLGLWQDVLADVECDACIFDAPYSERVHRGHNAGVNRNNPIVTPGTRKINYGFLTPEDVRKIVDHWSPRTHGWFVSITSHDLVPRWEDALRSHGRLVFPPLPLVDRRKGRIAADGPASWTVSVVVARPRTVEFARWGALTGEYRREKGEPRGTHMGGKPLGVMRRIVRDYAFPGPKFPGEWPTRPRVCDPFAGGGTTLMACAMEGCDAIGSEVDADVHAAAVSRLADVPTIPGRDGTLPMFG